MTSSPFIQVGPAPPLDSSAGQIGAPDREPEPARPLARRACFDCRQVVAAVLEYHPASGMALRMQRVDTNEPAVELEPFDAAASMIVDGKTVNSYPYYMRTPEEYASDYPEDPARVLAAQLVDLGNQLNFELIDVPEADEERNLRIEHYLEVIRAWKTKEMANGG